MKVSFVASDLSYPPTEGLHEQTVALVAHLAASGHEVRVVVLKRPHTSLDVDALGERVGVRLAHAPFEYRSSSLTMGLMLRLRWPFGAGGHRRQLMRLVWSDADVVHLEHAAAIGLFRRRMAARTVVSFVDPGSRRQYRLARASTSAAGAIRHAVASVGFSVLELMARPGTPVWHVVSTSDASYLRARYRHPNVRAIEPLLSANTSRMEDIAPGGVLRVLVPLDLRVAHMRRAAIALGKAFHRHQRTTPSSFTILMLCRVRPSDDVRRAWAATPATFTPWVPDFVDAVEHSDVVVLPDLAGTGVKVRALHALSAGRAVIGTEVAFEGIDVADGRDALVVRHLDAVPGLVNDLVVDRERVLRLGDAARGVVDDARTRRAWDDLFRTLQPSNRPPGESR